MENTKRIALERLKLIVAAEGPATPEVVGTVLAELAHLGVKVQNPGDLTDKVITDLGDLTREIRRLRGEKGTYAPLFPGFPEKLPEHDNAELRFYIAAARLAGNVDPSDDEIRAALDFSDIGWWPASSVPQDEDATRVERARQETLPGDTRIEWMPVTVVTPAQAEVALKEYMQDLFASAASLREDVRTDLAELVQTYGIQHIDTETVRFRENRTLLLRLLWENDRAQLAQSGATPDDLLRLFADLTESDTSLTEKIRYPRFSRADRRAVVNTLEASPRLGEIFRRRGLWLAVEKGLHLGEWKAERTQEAFGRLRETRHDKTSLPSRFEALLRADHSAAVDLLAAEAPGLLGRNLRRLAGRAESAAEHAHLAEMLEKVGKEIPLRILLAAQKQMKDNGATYPRVAFTKSGKAKRIENPAGHLSVGANEQTQYLSALSQVVEAQLQEKGSWEGEKVYIDPVLEGVLLPDQLRSTAQGVVQAERGTRLPLGDGKVVRLFVHWKDGDETTDLDLSLMALDENFEVIEHVSWTRLANGAMTHSGDLTSAPLGAQEFIDVDLSKVKAQKGKRKWRYLAPSILRYAGARFDALPEATVGWMLRDKVSSNVRTFDPATVVNAFTLTGSQRTAAPILVDLETSEVLYVDVYLSGSGMATVERDGTSITNVVKAVSARKETKTNVAELARAHAAARGGEVVTTREESTISFGLTEGHTYNALQPEKLLAELL